MNEIKISIIVPVYNTEQYLKRCLDSLVNQTLKEIEIICVNDKSPDNSISILREYENKYPGKVVVIDSPVNLRQGGARNIGMKISKGSYIGFVDSDDWVNLDMYEKLYNKTSNEKAEIVYCDYQTAMSESGPFTHVHGTISADCESKIEQTKKALLLRPSSIWSGMYSRDLFIDNNIFFPEKLFYEDNYIIPLLILKAKIIKKVDQPLVNYFIGNVSVTRSFNNKNFFDRVTTAKMMLEDCRKINAEDCKGKYIQEIEFLFIEIFFINTTKGCLKNFLPMKFKELMKVRQEIKNLVPEFKDNKYLQNKLRSNRKYRIYFYLLTYFPHSLLLIYSIFSIHGYYKFKKK